MHEFPDERMVYAVQALTILTIKSPFVSFCLLEHLKNMNLNKLIIFTFRIKGKNWYWANLCRKKTNTFRNVNVIEKSILKSVGS